jgi:Amt family ammonium transporter
VVHSVGGWAALAGVIVLGPRIGKYTKDGKVRPIPGHNMTSAALGVLILWLGWFGFNPGSTMAAMNGSAIAHVLVNTNIAAATGAPRGVDHRVDLPEETRSLHDSQRVLAGLVAITAPCAFVSIGSGALIGFIGGILAVMAVLFFDKIKIDDPVGALSVHLVNGVWGTLALGLFWNKDITSSVAALPPTGLAGRPDLGCDVAIHGATQRCGHGRGIHLHRLPDCVVHSQSGDGHPRLGRRRNRRSGHRRTWQRSLSELPDRR